ncbi:MAG: dihydroorotase [Alphaproteobacteria bacterium]
MNTAAASHKSVSGTHLTAYVNARMVDPATGYDGPGELLTQGGLIVDAGPGLFPDGTPEGCEIIDCAGQVLCPGLIDMKVFAGEPGAEHKETLESASLAAAAGGVTTIITMPNTEPVIDDISLVEFLKRRARFGALVNVHPMAAATQGLKGLGMSEIGLMRQAGAVAFTDGVQAVANAVLMRRLLSYASRYDALIVQHLEEPTLAEGGCMNEGEIATRLGLAGIPDAAETIMLERDLRLVELTGARYHAEQLSCAASVEIMRQAKRQGLPVSCGVSAAHLALNENDIGSYRTFFKLSPPLRREEDRVALVAGVADGVIDVIVSGHNPQDQESKRLPFAQAATGGVGLETLLSVALICFHDGHVSLPELLARMTINPARLLGLPGGKLARGQPADLLVFNPGKTWVVTGSALRSKSKNTPFEDRHLQGVVMRTVVSGETVFIREEI